MEYIYGQNAADATTQLATTIKELLDANKKVLWFVSGGSGGQVSIDVAKKLQNTPLENLYVTLTDERYGPVGHANENWQQLLDGGFSLPGAMLYRPLTGSNREETAKQFASWLGATFDAVDYVIGLFGIGPDGHTAGIKPQSKALTAAALATDFTGEDFERITITPTAIERVDEAVIQAFGENKFVVINQLQTESLPAAIQPAQLLKEVPKATLYSNYKRSAL